MTYVKSSEKLPRGSYFYIRVGNRFYAGEVANIVERKVEPKWEWGDSYGRKIDASVHPRTRNPRDRRDIRKKNLANYRSQPKRLEPKKIVEFDGTSISKLVDAATEAKQFRRKAQADNACEKLKRIYGSLGVKVVIEFKKGES